MLARGWRTAVLLLLLVPCAVAKGKGGRAQSSSNGNGEEEIIIPLGGEMDFGGPQGGGFSIPLDPAMIQPQLGGGQGSMGFEETEEIGPDGKPHIISEHSFGGPMKSPKGKPLTSAQKKQQKMMQKQMEGMAKDMAHMFDDGSFFGGVRPGQAAKDRKYQRDLFKNAIKAFDNADMNQLHGQPMINNRNSYV